MKMNMERWIEQIIRQKKVAAVPIMTHPGIELGKRTVREAVSDGQIHYEAVMRLCERYPSAAACTIMDLTTEAECFGAEIEFSDIAVPAVRGRLLSDTKDIGRLRVPSLASGRIPEYLKANLLAAEQISDRPLFAGCIGPFSLAGRLYDMSDIMVLICEEPDAAHELLSKCTEFILKYCLALRETGANGVVMAEPREIHRREGADTRILGGAPQLRQYGPLHQGHGRDGCRHVSFRQQVRHVRSNGRRTAHGHRNGQHRPREHLQGCHACADETDREIAARSYSEVPQFRALQRMRHAAPHPTP